MINFNWKNQKKSHQMEILTLNKRHHNDKMNRIYHYNDKKYNDGEVKCGEMKLMNNSALFEPLLLYLDII